MTIGYHISRKSLCFINDLGYIRGMKSGRPLYKLHQYYDDFNSLYHKLPIKLSIMGSGNIKKTRMTYKIPTSQSTQQRVIRQERIASDHNRSID